MAYCWVRIMGQDGKWLVPSAEKIKPTPDDVADLRRDVKQAFVNKLKEVDAGDLVVYAPEDGERKTQLRPSAPVPADSTDEKPIIVVAPSGPIVQSGSGPSSGDTENKGQGGVFVEESTGAFMKTLQAKNIPFIEDCHIKVSNISLGGGNFGNAYLGMMFRYNRVVVKVPKVAPGEDVHTTNKNTCHEALLMYSCITHPNIARLVGTTKIQGLRCLILAEYDTSLEKYVDIPENKWAVNCGTLLRIMYDICLGVQNMHILNMVHMDLASRNILLDKSLRAFVTDFGQVREIGEKTNRAVPYAITSMSNDDIKEDDSYLSTPLTDIKQLGLLFLSMITDEPTNKNTEFDTLSKPPSCDDKLWNLLGRCIGERQDRPKNCSELLDSLAEALKPYEPRPTEDTKVSASPPLVILEYGAPASPSSSASSK